RSINPRHIGQPVRDIRGRRRFDFRRDDVSAIDPAGRRVALASGALEYDYLVFALGSRTDYFGIPGAREHTWDFKSLEDAVVLRERILDICEHADHVADPAVRRQMLTFVVVGGGYTGVELVSEMRDFLFHYVAERYRGIPRADIRLVVLEAAPEILRGVHPKLAQHAAKRLRVEGIEIRLGAKVTRCFPDGIEINGSEIISAETLIWTAGVRAHPLVEALPGPHDRIARVLVNERLQLEGHPEIFVVGDSAAAASAKDAPRVAPVAIAQGKLAARNIAHRARRAARRLPAHLAGGSGLLGNELCRGGCCRAEVERLLCVVVLERGAPVQAGGTEKAVAGGHGLVARGDIPPRRLDCAPPAPLQTLRHR